MLLPDAPDTALQSTAPARPKRQIGHLPHDSPRSLHQLLDPRPLQLRGRSSCLRRYGKPALVAEPPQAMYRHRNRNEEIRSAACCLRWLPYSTARSASGSKTKSVRSPATSSRIPGSCRPTSALPLKLCPARSPEQGRSRPIECSLPVGSAEAAA
ncbi:hypothetical protein D3C77_406590 [compost metagenome]